MGIANLWKGTGNMRESEAGNKWCPFAIADQKINFGDGDEIVVRSNRTADGLARGNCKCLGSDCAMWMQSTHEDYGHCGLASRPNK